MSLLQTLDVGTAELFVEIRMMLFMCVRSKMNLLVLDSGADFCMAPREFGKFGCRSTMEKPILRDAQGAQIHISDMRDSKIITQDTEGHNACIRGTFAAGQSNLFCCHWEFCFNKGQTCRAAMARCAGCRKVCASPSTCARTVYP